MTEKVYIYSVSIDKLIFFSPQMHLISSLLFFALGAILINSAPFDQKLKTGSQEVKDLSEISAFRQNSPILPLTTFRDFIKGHSHDFCFRRLALSLG